MTQRPDSGRITLYVAMSVDGYIADVDGGVDWLDAYDADARVVAGETAEAGYRAFFETVDALVMGATTYEQVLEFGQWPYGEKPTVVVTGRELPRATESVELYAGDLSLLADRLRSGYDTVWHVGGGALARSFLERDLLDQLRLVVMPELLGDGVALFEAGIGGHDLDLLSTTQYAGGVVELRYEVLRKGAD